MKLQATIESVEKSFDNLTKSLPPEIVFFLKQRFEAFVQNLLKLDFTNISVDFVVDTNTIISSLKRYARGKGSILFELANNPIFKFHAPTYIELEVTKFIQQPQNKKVDHSKFVEGWRKIKKILRIGSQVSINALTLANVIIGKKDPKDIPFVAMYIDLGAHKIITYDRHFDHPLLQPLKIDKVGQVVAGVYKGLLSFFVLNDLTPAALEFFGQIMMGLVKILFDTIKLLLNFFTAASRNAIEEAISLIANFFPEIRSWIESGAINTALLMLALVVGGAVIVDKNIKNNLQSLIDFIIKSLQTVIDNLISWLDKSIKSVLDIGKILLPDIAAVILVILTNISKVVSHLKLLPSQTSMQE